MQEHDTNDTFGEDDMKDASALNSTFGDDDTKDSSALNSTFGEYNAKDASALNSTWSTSTSAMEAIDDIEEDSYSQKSESSLRVLCRVIASGLFGFPVDTVSMCRCCGADDKQAAATRMLRPNESTQ